MGVGVCHNQEIFVNKMAYWEKFRHDRANTESGQPRRPASKSRTQQKSFLFLLEEKNRRANISKTNCFKFINQFL